MKKILKSFCQFEIKGLNQERTFNELSKRYKIFDYERKSKEVALFKTSFFSGKKVQKELLGQGFEILSLKRKGFLNFFFNSVISYGLIAGMCLGFAFCFVQASFIRKIEVWGNQNIEDVAVIQVVSKNIGSGLKSKIDTKKIENEVYASFSNLSFVSVAVVGQTIILNIKEEIVPDEMKGDFKPIYSGDYGRITNINLIQGTLAVTVGDIVREGQVLVYPYILNSSGVQMPVKPVAKIEADVWIEEQASHNSYYIESYKTGKTLTKNEVYLGKLKIYEKEVENRFSSFEVEEESEILDKNNILPFVLKTTTYFETSTRVIEESFDSVKDKIISKARENALQKIEDCDIIKSENFTIKQAGNITNVSYVITISKDIGG